ncbi:MAG: hypothetical protein RLZZ136_699, partial [Pseudomonadota bacterium]
MSQQTLKTTPIQKTLITGSVIVTTLVVALDASIANVAIPNMQASLSASPDQVMWVLTSYLISTAIMMPLASWLASRFGRKRVMVISIIGFTLASLACGMARSLEFMVFARIIQGVSGAGMIPLGQATLLDINPREKQPSAMALTGLGAMLGPLAGPTLGGWLTDNYSWRWVFLINIPIGLIAIIGILISHIETRDKSIGKFDAVGFASLSVFIGAFQLMIDRGLQKDWFESAEICLEAGIVALAFYLTLVHMLSRRDTFVRATLFTDRNFTIGCMISTLVGVIIFGSNPIQTIMTQNLLGYTPLQNGLVSMPRAIGTVLSLLVINRVITKVDARKLLSLGLILSVFSLGLYARLSLETDQTPILLAGFLQGLSAGMLIAPLSALTFSTLSPSFRNEGTAIYSLTRNLGNSLGISAIQIMSIHETSQVAARLSEGIRPDSPLLAFARPDIDWENNNSVAQISRELW